MNPAELAEMVAEITATVVKFGPHPHTLIDVMSAFGALALSHMTQEEQDNTQIANDIPAMMMLIARQLCNQPKHTLQ